MRLEGAMEVFRQGRFAVLDRGVPQSLREQREDRPRYGVVEYDDQGPIMRAGPFRVLRLAVEACQQMSFRHELEEEPAPRRSIP
jgi:hypothetical protein